MTIISLNDLAEQEYSIHISEPEETWDQEYENLRLKLPKGVDVRAAVSFGFYEYKNRYWIRRKDDVFDPVSNFTMKVEFLIEGANPKRVVTISNVHGKSRTIDFAIEDLISVEKFKAKVEAQGNFLFEGRAPDLGKIKNKLFTQEKPAIEISRLGQHKNRFWVWANGIFDGQNFYGIDEKGMVKYDNEYFFIPVFGETKAEDDEDLRNYRRFLHRESRITFQEWAKLYCEVYGENGVMSLGFAFFALFSDIIFEKTKASPILFLFGQRGSGKGTMAASLMNLWGVPQDPLMLGGASTVVGFMRKLAQFSNAITWLDEYKNDIGDKKIESLKNIWDRVGYERGVKDNSNRTSVSPVTSSAIISGQEIPNVEPALFSRVTLLEFKTMERTQAEADRFNELRALEADGITCVTHEILCFADIVREKFMPTFKEVSGVLRQAFMKQEVVDRQIVNYSIYISLIMILEERLKMPFNSGLYVQLVEKALSRQLDAMKTANEVQQFWEMIDSLLGQKIIRNGEHIQVKDGLVKIRMAHVVGLYREYSRRQGIKFLDRGTLTNYMQASLAYDETESKKPNHRFRFLQNPTSAMVFLHEEITRLYGVKFDETSDSVEDQQIISDIPPY